MIKIKSAGVVLGVLDLLRILISGKDQRGLLRDQTIFLIVLSHHENYQSFMMNLNRTYQYLHGKKERRNFWKEKNKKEK